MFSVGQELFPKSNSIHYHTIDKFVVIKGSNSYETIVNIFWKNGTIHPMGLTNEFLVQQCDISLSIRDNPWI